ncbi:MAG: SAM-dependent methyltransferase, partial [Acidimicrobiales bacterium]
MVIAGLGPAGPSLVPAETLRALSGAARVFVRTRRHPAIGALTGPVTYFDDLYERAERFEDAYEAIVETV